MGGTILEAFRDVLPAQGFTFRDALDLGILLFLLYRLIRFVRGTQATHIFLGGFGVVALFVTASLLELRLLTQLLRNVLPYVAFAGIVVFQAEIRKLLASIGRALFSRTGPTATDDVLDEIINIESARRDYGVVIEAGRVDIAATGSLRGQVTN